MGFTSYFRLRITTLILFCLTSIAVPQSFSQDCNTVPNFTLSDITGNIGDEICTQVAVNNFTDISSFQGTFTFDPSVLQFKYCIGGDIPGLDCSDPSGSGFNLDETDNGYIIIVWFSSNPAGYTLNDGQLIMQFCFDIIGEPNDDSAVQIADYPKIVEVTQEIDALNFNAFYFDDICSENGEVSILCSNFDSFVSNCPASDASSTGAISLYSCGGNPNYTIRIDGINQPGNFQNNETATFTDLNPGAHTIEVIDANNNVITKNVTINIAPQIQIDADIDTVSCATRDNSFGAIRLDISGGSPPYNLSWDNIPIAEDTLTLLPAGAYTVTVEDSNGCSVSESYDISREPLLISLDLIQAAACERQTSFGTVQLNLSGGLPNASNEYKVYIFNTDTGTEQGTPLDYINGSILNLPAGNYVFYITDSAAPVGQCESNRAVFNMPATKIMTADLVLTPISCFGEVDASIAINNVSSDGGTAAPPFRYTVKKRDFSATSVIFVEVENVSINSTNYIFNSIDTGEYRVEVIDNQGCPWDSIFTISAPPEIFIDSLNFVAPDCSSGGTGSIEILATGGAEGFTYSWSDGNMSNIRTDINAGIYMVTATDINGCEAPFMFDVPTSGSIVQNSVTSTDVSCDGTMGGSIRIDISSATDLTFDWGDGNGAMVWDSVRTDLPLGNYSITVSNGMDCDLVIPAMVSSPATFTVATNEVQIPTCPGDTDGNIAVTVSPIGQYSYEWNHPNNTGQPILAGVPTGTYEVTITDRGTGCGIPYMAVLSDAASIDVVVDLNSVVATSCSGMTDGSILVSASGGTVNNGSYLYTWSNTDNDNGMDSYLKDNLEDGEGWVIVSDGVCATAEIPFSIPAGPSPSVDLTASSFQDVSCFGANDGSITIEATGGNGGYTYFWPDLINGTNTIVNQGAGDYGVRIADRLGCIALDTFTITEPSELMVAVDSTRTINLSCGGMNTGQINLDVEGGNIGGYTYTWTGSTSTTDNASNLGEGMYTVTVTDINMCSAETAYTLTAPTAVFAELAIPDDILCFNGQTGISISSVSGGTGTGYRFSNSFDGFTSPIGDTINVTAGSYNIYVFDSEGCSYDTTIVVDQPEEFTINLGNPKEIRLGDTVELGINPSNFLIGLDTIYWESVDATVACLDPSLCFTVSAQPTEETIYRITAVDLFGCETSDEIVVTIDKTRGVYIPSVFTPSNIGDTNNNDHFGIGVDQDVEMVELMEIYDRWGNQVYSIEAVPYENNVNDMIGNWNGSYLDNPLPDGVYQLVVSIRFRDGIIQNFREGIHLMR